MTRVYRSIAGNLELFCGCYFAAFGTLAAIYFARIHRPRVEMACAAVALFGLLLIFRAERLLGWKRWLFWIVAVAITIVPVVWLFPR